MAAQLSGQLDSADAAYCAILAIDPEHAAANHCRGMLLLQRHRSQEALPHLLKALDAQPQVADYWLGCLEALLHAGRLGEAQTTLRLAQGYGLPTDLHDEFQRRLELAKLRELETRPIEAQNCELLDLVRIGDFDAALALAKRLTEMHPSQGLAWKVLGGLLWRCDQREEAIMAMTVAASRLPSDVEAHANLGMALAALQQLDLAEASLRNVLLIDSAHALANQQLGIAKLRLGKPGESIKYFLVALTAQPENADYWLCYLEALRQAGQVGQATTALAAARRLGSGVAASVVPAADPRQSRCERELEALLARRRLDQALRMAEKLIQRFPLSGTAWKVFGALSWERERTVEAAQAMQRAVQLLPHSAEALTNFGSALSALSRYEEAQICLRQAILLDPTYLAAYYRLATHCGYHARADEAQAILRRALGMRSSRLTRDDAIAWSDLIFLVSHDSRYDAPALRAEHHGFQACVEAPLRVRWPIHDNSRKPDRRLRLGFVSGDFRWHAVAIFFEPILERLTAMPGYVLYGYSSNAAEDAVTGRLRALFDHWCSVEELLEYQLAAKIREDRIDILIDLSGHTAFSRLAAFALKPAPIQISWLGYPASTGLEAMDYYFADARWLPPGEYDHLFTEKLAYLPDRWAYAPRGPDQQIGPLPALTAGHFTFASFHQVRKLNLETIQLWAALLTAVPEARLLVVGFQWDDQKDWLIAQFKRYGTPESRLSLHRHSEFTDYLTLHHRVDLCLDAQPYCGGTTSMHALWMGVPTLTLAGGTAPGRAGAGIALSVGLDSFIARDREDFVAKGVFWSRHRAELAELRPGLRERVRNSPGGDPDLIAAHIDHALRHMWQRWCAKLPPESFHSSVLDQSAGGPKLSKPNAAVLDAVNTPAVRREATTP